MTILVSLLYQCKCIGNNTNNLKWAIQYLITQLYNLVKKQLVSYCLIADLFHKFHVV